MATKATIVLSEEERPDGSIVEKMEINYDIDKDPETGDVIVRSNVIGMSRIMYELFRFGILERMSRVFVPAPDLKEQLDRLSGVEPAELAPTE